MELQLLKARGLDWSPPVHPNIALGGPTALDSAADTHAVNATAVDPPGSDTGDYRRSLLGIV